MYSAYTLRDENIRLVCHTAYTQSLQRLNFQRSFVSTESENTLSYACQCPLFLTRFLA